MTAYEEGFTKTCAALGVDPTRLSGSPFAGAQAPKLNLADPAAIPVIRLRTGNLDTGVSAHFPMTLFNPGTATLAGLDDYYKDVSKDRGVQQKLTSGAIDPKYYGAHTAAVSRVTAPFRRLRATLTDPTFRIDPAVVRQALGGRPPYETYKQLISDYHREMRGLTGTVSRASAPAKGAMP